MAFLKPAFSKALFQASAASRIRSRHASGVVLSIHQVIV
jgi:hypothetical protein